MEGSIDVKTEVGIGTSFEILLPKCTNLLTEETIPALKVEMGVGRILLVDDEDLVVSGMRELLKDVGYTVTATTDPDTALELFRKEPGAFDLVFTDQSMPKMTGLDLTKAIRAIRADIPVILATGYSREATENTVSKLGIQGFLKKPFSFTQLHKLIAHILHKYVKPDA